MNCELLSAFCVCFVFAQIICFVFAQIITTIKQFTIVSKHTNGHVANSLHMVSQQLANFVHGCIVLRQYQHVAFTLTMCTLT